MVQIKNVGWKNKSNPISLIKAILFLDKRLIKAKKLGQNFLTDKNIINKIQNITRDIKMQRYFRNWTWNW